MRALEINEKGEFKEVKTEKNEQKITIMLDIDIYKQIKINSVLEGSSMKKYIEKALRKDIESKDYPQGINERLYNSKDLALFLQCDRRTITNYYKSKKIKGVMYKNEYWSTADQVKEFLDYRNKENKK